MSDENKSLTDTQDRRVPHTGPSRAFDDDSSSGGGFGQVPKLTGTDEHTQQTILLFVHTRSQLGGHGKAQHTVGRLIGTIQDDGETLPTIGLRTLSLVVIQLPFELDVLQMLREFVTIFITRCTDDGAIVEIRA
jgi:hypothetical protein